jgi:hypothetical protein
LLRDKTAKRVRNSVLVTWIIEQALTFQGSTSRRKRTTHGACGGLRFCVRPAMDILGTCSVRLPPHPYLPLCRRAILLRRASVSCPHPACRSHSIHFFRPRLLPRAPTSLKARPRTTAADWRGDLAEGERFTATDERHCVNSISIKYVDAAAPDDLREAPVCTD